MDMREKRRKIDIQMFIVCECLGACGAPWLKNAHLELLN
jgi:hypothetical protein